MDVYLAYSNPFPGEFDDRILNRIQRESQEARRMKAHDRPDHPRAEQSYAEAKSREIRLIDEARKGDPNAFRELIELHVRPLSAICRRMMENDADAQDAMCETMVKVWANLPSLRDAAKFAPFLRRVSAYTCLDLLRKKKAFHALAPISLDGPVLGQGDDALILSSILPDLSAEGEMELVRTRPDFNLCWSLLSDEDRVVLTFVYRLGWGFRDIGRLIGDNEKTAYQVGKYHIRGALQRLQSHLVKRGVDLAPSIALQFLEEREEAKGVETRRKDK